MEDRRWSLGIHEAVEIKETHEKPQEVSRVLFPSIPLSSSVIDDR